MWPGIRQQSNHSPSNWSGISIWWWQRSSSLDAFLGTKWCTTFLELFPHSPWWMLTLWVVKLARQRGKGIAWNGNIGLCLEELAQHMWAIRHHQFYVQDWSWVLKSFNFAGILSGAWHAAQSDEGELDRGRASSHWEQMEKFGTVVGIRICEDSEQTLVIIIKCIVTQYFMGTWLWQACDLSIWSWPVSKSYVDAS